MLASPPSIAGNWVRPYIGKPWRNGARGPDAFDCWGLLWHVYYFYLNTTLPIYPGVDAKDGELVARMVDAETQDFSTGWTEVSEPKEFDGVAMGRANIYSHIGIYTDGNGGMIVHANDGHKVVAMRVSLLRLAGVQLKFYRHGNHR
jgi:cell wall-associated NlpC family hydrolase